MTDYDIITSRDLTTTKIMKGCTPNVNWHIYTQRFAHTMSSCTSNAESNS